MSDSTIAVSSCLAGGVSCGVCFNFYTTSGFNLISLSLSICKQLALWLLRAYNREGQHAVLISHFEDFFLRFLQTNFVVIEMCCHVFVLFWTFSFPVLRLESTESAKTVKPRLQWTDRSGELFQEITARSLPSWKIDGLDGISAFSGTKIDARTKTLHYLPCLLLMLQTVRPHLDVRWEFLQGPDLHFHYRPFPWWMEGSFWQMQEIKNG